MCARHFRYLLLPPVQTQRQYDIIITTVVNRGWREAVESSGRLEETHDPDHAALHFQVAGGHVDGLEGAVRRL